ncbi:MAG TPA: phosphatase domain-containing protein [Gemmatimonadaceae bacterium]
MTPGWRELSALASELAGDAKRAVDRALGKTGAYHVIGYRGYGTAHRALLLGRVLEHTRIAHAEASQARWRNALATLQRIDSAPLPFATVHARLGAIEARVVADDEGFLRHWFAAERELRAGEWHTVNLDVVAGPETPIATAAHVPARILVPSTAASLGVISDMDDTVLQSEVTSFVRAVQLMLLENARTRLPFPGVAAFYRALERGTLGAATNPIFYVSNSPWNLHDVIADFLDAQEIPAGPLLLRDWDIGRDVLGTRAYKLTQIREILATYPALPFILVGDSGQEDPEIYGTLVREFPGRILAIYIRNVSPHAERSASIRALARQVTEAGSTLLLADDTLAAARHAAAHGWISEDALGEIGEEKHADERSRDADAPTIIVDPEVKRRDIE